MADAETPEGMRLLYDLLVKSAEFPGESPHNIKNLYNWGEKMKALHHLLSSYHDEDYKKEYRSAMKRIMEISREYPSPKYISEYRTNTVPTGEAGMGHAWRSQQDHQCGSVTLTDEEVLRNTW